MTLAELAVSYRAQVNAIQSCIRLAEAMPEGSLENRADKRERLRILGGMLRDVRDMAVWCEHYYDRSYHRSDHYRV